MKPERRSPIKSPPLRMPGESLQEQLEDLVFDKWMAYGLAVLVVWMLAALDWVRLGFHVQLSWKTALSSTLFACAFPLFALFKTRGTVARVRNLRLGRDGEVAVGQFLDEYARQRGYKVLHDLQGDGFNVDHVLVGPGGIFGIDTKAYSKPRLGERVTA